MTGRDEPGPVVHPGMDEWGPRGKNDDVARASCDMRLLVLLTFRLRGLGCQVRCPRFRLFEIRSLSINFVIFASRIPRFRFAEYDFTGNLRIVSNFSPTCRVKICQGAVRFICHKSRTLMFTQRSQVWMQPLSKVLRTLGLGLSGSRVKVYTFRFRGAGVRDFRYDIRLKHELPHKLVICLHQL